MESKFSKRTQINLELKIVLLPESESLLKILESESKELSNINTLAYTD